MAGFRRFRQKFFLRRANSVYRRAEGQSPKTLIIACSDSRVDPAILSSAEPGDLFVVRNVANLVPPFERDTGFHGVSAAIEFAVDGLKVENIVVVGHRQCGGIRSLFEPSPVRPDGFVAQWMSIADGAKARVLDRMPDADQDTLCRQCEQESILVSLDNLKTFPFVAEAIAQRGLQLLGIYFDLESGVLMQLDQDSRSFVEVEI
jgi:carbonic anhydrase